MSTGVIFILDKGVSPILASGVRSTLAPGVIRAWVFQGVLFGGFAYDGAYAGLAYAYTNSAATYTGAYIGSRLCFIPAA